MSAERPYEIVMEGLMAFDLAMQRARRMRELMADLGAPNRCGECQKWMTKTCPQERSSMTGFSQGPHCNVTACREFIIKPAYVEIRNAKQAQLDALVAQA